MKIKIIVSEGSHLKEKEINKQINEKEGSLLPSRTKCWWNL